ncbi:xaa-Pro aminopeptidase 1 [Anabrus simplex]|uniref:xaa-Pro aminopeptidase 1 n=1 Tax=Anabrus simplex TaxID=316456 RepID=UPI0035A306D5
MQTDWQRMQTAVVTLFAVLVLNLSSGDAVSPVQGTHSIGVRSIRPVSILDRTSCRLNGKPSRYAVETSQRLERLRQEMRNYYISAYIVSSGDEHQSEYIANHDKRREYISGFSGSAGDAVITLEKAALWTDSRYYIQADNQLDCNWLLMKNGVVGVPSIREWITAELGRGNNVSADPKIISYTDWISWNSSFASSGITLKLITDNLVDKIWGENQGREPYSDAEIIVHDMAYAGVSWQDKLTTVRSVMSEQDADVLVVTALDEIAWALNLRGEDVPYTPVFRSYLIIGHSYATLYLPKYKITKPIKDHLNIHDIDSAKTVKVKLYDEFWNDLSSMPKTVKKILLPSPMSYAKGVSYYVYHLLPAKKVSFTPSPLLTMKDIKNDIEAEGMRNAHIRDAIPVCQILRKLEEGIDNEVWDELRVATTVDELRKKQVLNRGPSFSTIAAFGPNAALPHYVPTQDTNLKINASSVFMLDSGGQYLDGTTDVTRTIHLGVPTDFQIKIYTALLKGCIDLVTARFPEGQTLSKLEVLIREPLYYEGLDYGHGSTHGIGAFLGVHEAFNTTYHKNFFGSQEPGYYESNNFGMRLENIVTVVSANLTYQGKEFFTFEPVTLVPYERKLINISDLTPHQLQWLNDYHQKIRELVGEEMNRQDLGEDRLWLLDKTEPLSPSSS